MDKDTVELDCAVLRPDAVAHTLEQITHEKIKKIFLSHYKCHRLHPDLIDYIARSTIVHFEICASSLLTDAAAIFGLIDRIPLIMLDISWCRIGDLSALPAGLGNLLKLDLSANNITDATPLIAAMTGSRLNKLEFSSNKCTSVAPIAQAVLMCPTLRELDISGSRFVDMHVFFSTLHRTKLIRLTVGTPTLNLLHLAHALPGSRIKDLNIWSANFDHCSALVSIIPYTKVFNLWSLVLDETTGFYAASKLEKSPYVLSAIFVLLTAVVSPRCHAPIRRLPGYLVRKIWKMLIVN
jgi:hypothetical protein